MGILQLGVPKGIRDFGIWNTILSQVHWTQLPYMFVEVYRLVLEQPMKFDFSEVLNSAYGVSLNLNFGQ
jgi:hypothetical protein